MPLTVTKRDNKPETVKGVTQGGDCAKYCLNVVEMLNSTNREKLRAHKLDKGSKFCVMFSSMDALGNI